MNLWLKYGDQRVLQGEKTENKLDWHCVLRSQTCSHEKFSQENRGEKKEDWQWKSEERQTWTLDRHAREGEGAEEVSFPNPLTLQSRLVELDSYTFLWSFIKICSSQSGRYTSLNKVYWKKTSFCSIFQSSSHLRQIQIWPSQGIPSTNPLPEASGGRGGGQSSHLSRPPWPTVVYFFQAGAPFSIENA